jgi:hypothetical protein
MNNVKLFQSAHAVQSLRESDFDNLSAYGEAIDNSLQAGASEIKIKFGTTKHRSRHHIESLAFGDNGIGMGADVLHQCLQIGYSSRFNDRSGIGRFGVGMTLGAIHECKRIEVWSKQKGGAFLKTYMDLDEVGNREMDEIPAPEESKLPAEFEELVGSDSGTLVLWRKYDKQEDSADKIVENLKVWLGRTYRYFIWGSDHKGQPIPGRDEPAKFWIQWEGNEEVKAIDPLYARLENTAYPDDPKAEVFADMDIKWPADQNAPVPGAESTVTVRMSLLPEKFREKRGAGGGKNAMARNIHLNEGISILRNHREVFYGNLDIRGGKTGWSNFEEIDRWWGGEVLFSPEVDRAFTVKNIKRGAKPQYELKLTIKEKMLPTRRSCIEQVKDVWKKNDIFEKEKKQKELDDSLLKRAGKHDEAEGTAKKTPTPTSQLDKEKNLETEANEKAKTYKRYDEEQKSRLAELFKAQPFTIMQDEWKGFLFYEPNFLGGNAVLDYNMRHPFWERVYELVDDLENKESKPEEIAKEIRIMLDLVMISHAKAESMFEPNVEFTAERFIEQIRTNWGLYLQNYVKTRDKELGKEDA